MPLWGSPPSVVHLDTPGSDACVHAMRSSISIAPYHLTSVRKKQPDLGRPLVEAIKHLTGERAARHHATQWDRAR
jgi:hypothetical protein